MQFLSPGVLAMAAALTIPPLVALYFLKLKRQIHPISSTLLWRKAIEDLHVNAPFQRLRSSLLLLLQLLVLILAALALGQPLLARSKPYEQTLILMIDQSASMGVIESDGRSRLEHAREQAKKVIDNMDEEARAMVIAFCDRATMVSSFGTDREAIKRRIDTIGQTDSTSTLSEAVSLAEAYSQNLIIGGETAGTDIPPQSAAAPASVVLFTDGRIEDAESVAPQRLDLSRMDVVRIGKRFDNVGILTMDARRNYETPEVLQVFATVRNFSDATMTFDATLYINGEHVDVQTVRLEPGAMVRKSAGDGFGDEDSDASVAAQQVVADDLAPPNSVASVAFDEIEYVDGGLVEVRLDVDDALQADNRAWTVIERPRRVDALLVTDGNHLLEKVLSHLNVSATLMTPDEYEAADEEAITERKRAKYDVVVFDRHSTDRLPPGNYMFWGAAPKLEGIEELDWTEAEIIIDWKQQHPVLRHTNVGSVNVFSWKRMRLPEDAVRLIEGETDESTVLAYFTRNGSQFLVSAFPLFVEDAESGTLILNTDWALRWDFVTFMYDAVQFLASTVTTGTLASLRPGEPQVVSIPPGTKNVTVRRPSGEIDIVPSAGASAITYARTRRVGTYEIEPAVEGQETLAVNLLSVSESNIAPRDTVVIGSSPVTTGTGESLINEPLWPYAVMVLVVFLMIEWVVYNKRVSV